MDQEFIPQYDRTFQHFISNIMPFPEDVLLQLAKGLKYIHSKNIVHLDIKPANVLFKTIRYKESVKVVFKWADFGLSKLVREDGQFSITNATGRIIGTTFWIAPEILLGNGVNDSNTSIKCDIWSAGCVFFYYLTEGKHPFGDLLNDNTEALFNCH